MRRKAFTLLELIIAFSIFITIMGLVLMSLTNSFRSLHRAQSILVREQKERLCIRVLSKEVASMTRMLYPEVRFKGDEKSFFLSSPGRITLLSPITFMMRIR